MTMQLTDKLPLNTGEWISVSDFVSLISQAVADQRPTHGVTISSLTADTVLTGAEIVPVLDGSTPKRLTLEQLQDYVLSAFGDGTVATGAIITATGDIPAGMGGNRIAIVDHSIGTGGSAPEGIHFTAVVNGVTRLYSMMFGGSSEEGGSVSWSSVTGKPTTFAPSAHASSHATDGSDAITPASIGAASLLALSSHTGATNPHNIGKAAVGLGNCDNTSDANKPVSTAQQAALDAKAVKFVAPSSINTTGLLRRYFFGNANANCGVSAYNGTWTGTERYVPMLLRGQVGVLGAHLSGGATWVSVPDTGLPTGASESTFSVWCNVIAMAAASPFFVYGTATNYLVRGFGAYAATPYWHMITRPGNSVGINSTVKADSLMRHLCVSFNGTSATITLDGVDLFSGSEASTLNTTLSGTAYIGCDLATTIRATCNLYDLRVYNRALSLSEKQAIFNLEA